MVISDTSPLNYLVLTGYIDHLVAIVGPVDIPEAVFRELSASRSPLAVRRWVSALPQWLNVRHCEFPLHPLVVANRLGAGEAEAITLATRDNATLLIDDEIGRKLASQQGVVIMGTLGILIKAARLGILDISEAILRVRKTTFYVSSSLLERTIKEVQGA